MVKTEWRSNDHWNDGNVRTIFGEGTDPRNRQFLVKQLSDDDVGFEGSFKIMGDGVAKFKSDSARLYVFKENPDSLETTRLWKPSVEVSCEIKVESIKHPQPGKNFVNVGGPTNHWTDKIKDNSNGRNYSVRAYFNRSEIGYEKETVHGVYDSVDALRYTQEKMPLNQWFKYRFKQTRLAPKNMKIEGWINNKAFGSINDTGGMTELNEESREKMQRVLTARDEGALTGRITTLQPVLAIGAYSGCYIRLNRLVKGSIKNLVVKEL